MPLGTPQRNAYELPPDTKFAAIHLAHCSCSDLLDELQLSSELSAYPGPIMVLTDLDKGRIGTDYAEAFEKSNLVLVASRVSQTPGILDGESLELEHRVYALLYSIFMYGFPNFFPGVLTLGSRVGMRDSWANRIALINDLYRHRDAIPFQVTADSLREAGRAVPGVLEVFRKDSDFVRLRRGINGLVRGWKSSSVLDRLHAFVRALDGLMKLQQGAGERQFAEKMQILATSQRLHDIALEIYRLRSYQEHLSDWPSKLAYIKEADRPRFVSHRAFQAEVLAGAAYRTLLADAQLLPQFTDSQLDAFWQSPDALWTQRFDLDSEDRRFVYSSER